MLICLRFSFKSIQVVPTGAALIDIVLSKTQRKTPTVVHKSYIITRIREFYMRKIKFAQQSFRDRLTQVLADFPILDVSLYIVVAVCCLLFGGRMRSNRFASSSCRRANSVDAAQSAWRERRFVFARAERTP